MLYVPETLAIIKQTRMSVVACKATSDIVQVTTRALLMNLGHVGRTFARHVPQIWELKEGYWNPLPFGKRVAQVEAQSKSQLATYERSQSELSTPCLISSRNT
jgi:hypothetical protein